MKLFKRCASIVGIIAIVFASQGCSTVAMMARHPANGLYELTGVLGRKAIIAPDHTFCPYDKNGVHHIRNMEKVVTAGTYVVSVDGTYVLIPSSCWNAPDSVRYALRLSERVEVDRYGNYYVHFLGDSYPVSVVPGYAFCRLLGPKLVVNYDASGSIDNPGYTEAYFYEAGSGNPGHRIATFLVPTCLWQRMLLPEGPVDFRWKGSGGANDPNWVPQVGAGVFPDVDGYLSLTSTGNPNVSVMEYRRQPSDFTIAGTARVPQCQALNVRRGPPALLAR